MIVLKFFYNTLCFSILFLFLYWNEWTITYNKLYFIFNYNIDLLIFNLLIGKNIITLNTIPDFDPSFQNVVFPTLVLEAENSRRNTQQGAVDWAPLVLVVRNLWPGSPGFWIKGQVSRRVMKSHVVSLGKGIKWRTYTYVYTRSYVYVSNMWVQNVLPCSLKWCHFI